MWLLSLLEDGMLVWPEFGGYKLEDSLITWICMIEGGVMMRRQNGICGQVVLSSLMWIVLCMKTGWSWYWGSSVDDKTKFLMVFLGPND